MNDLRRALRGLEGRFAARIAQVYFAISGAEHDKKALEWIDKVLTIEGNTRGVLTQRAMVLDRLGRPEEATEARALAAATPEEPPKPADPDAQPEKPEEE